jgi:hypothetical protein
MINTYRGVNINFGIGSTVTSVTGLFQTNDHALESDNEIIRDGTGAESEKTYYAFKQTATFEYVATQSGAANGAATVSPPLVGALITVTDTNYPLIAESSWLLDNVDIKRSNTAALRVTLKLTFYPQITS